MVAIWNLPSPASKNDQYYFKALDNALDYYSSYDRIVLIGDFNCEDHETCMETFLYQHNLKNIVKEGTCFEKTFHIDLFLFPEHKGVFYGSFRFS